MTSSTIAMLCQAQANNKTGDCLIAIRKLRLVSEADRIRRETEDGENICYKTEDQETCGGPCQGVSKATSFDRRLTSFYLVCQKHPLRLQDLSPWERTLETVRPS